jgi:putative transposase
MRTLCPAPSARRISAWGQQPRNEPRSHVQRSHANAHPRSPLFHCSLSALVLEALRMALGRRHPRPGLVHHSDRGVQYASRDYTAQLEHHGIRISMSRLATPYDNAQAESFMKTLKYEEVYRSEYRDLWEAKASIGQFLEKVYNQQRLHSALGYRPPLEFERTLRPKRALVKGRA